MVAAMVADDANLEDVRKCYRALKKAQVDLDLHPELYTHYYKKDFPERFHGIMDTRLFGPGERVVFEPYTEEMFNATRVWVEDWQIFPEGKGGDADYEASVLRVS